MENLSSDSDKSYPCNGGTRISLLTGAFTRSTQETDRGTPPHRLAPTTGSLKLQNQANFPSTSLYNVYCNTFKHNCFALAIGNTSKNEFVCFTQKARAKKHDSLHKRHLTFVYGHGKMLSHSKRLWRRRSGSPVFRESAFGASWYEDATDPSLPSRNSEHLPGASVCPR